MRWGWPALGTGASARSWPPRKTEKPRTGRANGRTLHQTSSRPTRSRKRRRMKDDISGAAAALSAIDVIASRKLPLDVMAVVAAAETMPGPSAQRPGDVVVSADGKTVEVVNTDAEGRLVLADALTHALR